MIELIEKMPEQSAADREAALLALLQPLLVQSEFSAASAEFLVKLIQLFGCERACIGFVDGRRIKIRAVSRHYQDMKRGSLPEVTAAMEESVLQDAILVYPHSANDFPYLVIAHAELVRANHLTSAITIPLAQQGELIGAITLESCTTTQFGAEQMWIMEKLAADVGPILYLKWVMDQSMWTRCRIAMRSKKPGTLSARLRPWLTASVMALLGSVLFVVPYPSEVTGQAKLEASIQRIITAPMDGYLKEVHVRPGSRVQENQLLAVLDEDVLRLQQRRAESEILQQENALAEAMAKADRTQVGIRSAKLEEVTAQRDLVQQQLSQTKLLAPFGGVVIKGDLTQLLGSPMKRSDPLLTLSQGDGFRVIMEVDEKDIRDIRLGQEGVLVLAALPADNFKIRLARIMPVSNISQAGQNVFEVEATVSGAQAASLAPGLKGVAKITTGESPVGWRWVMRAWYALKYAVWSRIG